MNEALVWPRLDHSFWCLSLWGFDKSEFIVIGSISRGLFDVGPHVCVCVCVIMCACVCVIYIYT